MKSNRSIPRPQVIPVLAYPDVDVAASWLSNAFGFRVRLRIFRHRIQMNVGDGALVVRELREGEVGVPLGLGHSVMIRVEDANAHCRRAREHGAKITQEPTTYQFGERQYNAVDFAGHCWTFSESVEDVHPETWGGTAEAL